MQKHQRIAHNSILVKLLFPMAIVLLLEGLLFTGILLWGGTTRQLNANAYDILGERVSNRKNYLQNEMVQHWSNISDSYKTINDTFREGLAGEGVSAAAFNENPTLTNTLLETVSEDLIYMLRITSANSAYVILDAPAGSTEHTALYIRDLDPGSNPSDRSDLLIECAPPALIKTLGIPMDTNWSARLDLPAENENFNFYHSPFDAALQHPGASPNNLGYWGRAHTIHGATDQMVISYSLPLLDETGTPYGVLGVDLTLDYLQKLLPYDELIGEKKGAYLLAVDGDGDQSFETVTASGPIYRRMVGTVPKVAFDQEKVHGSVHELLDNGRTSDTTYGSIQYLKLYNTNTPFVGEQWALIGLVEGGELLAFSQTVTYLVLIAFALSLGIGLVAVWVAGKRFTKPITDLSEKVRQSDPRQAIYLGKTYIGEVDALSSAIEHLSLDVADSSSKLAQILSLANIPIGAYEFSKDGQNVYCTGSFFTVLEVDGKDSPYLDMDLFKEVLAEATRFRELSENAIYRIQDCKGHPKWVKIQQVEEAGRTLGVVQDVTTETLEKRKIEYERDYDLLTNLYNRRAFQTVVTNLLHNPEVTMGAVIMWDLDDLKQVNDTYGHERGDDYIRTAAQALRQLALQGAVVSRMSGDEFYVFLYGGSRQRIEEMVLSAQNALDAAVYYLPEGKALKISASAGVAWYPEDAGTYDQLIRYADFAMYTVKNNGKGAMRSFVKADYERNSHLIQSRQELENLIREELVRFAFQPIVDARTGGIFAYEALMRPQTITLPSPPDVLRLATAQGKLDAIERLTIFKAMENFTSQAEAFGDAKVFINSIPNHILCDSDLSLLESRFGSFLRRVVIEIIENEQSDTYSTERKRAIVAAWDGKIALDDFGSGYNSELVLLTLNPHFVKIDMTIVRGIETDGSRQALLRNLISYCREREIGIIAEGVETSSELSTLIAMGVDYLQGYYLGRPNFVPQPIAQTIVEEIADLAAQAAH